MQQEGESTREDMQRYTPEEDSGQIVTMDDISDNVDIIFPAETMDTTRWNEMCSPEYEDLHPHSTEGPLPLPWIINTIALRRLRKGCIDDEAVNYYIQLLCGTHTALKCTLIHTYTLHRVFHLEDNEHYVSLSEHDHRTLRRLDLYRCDIIFAPIIFGNHITLITADRRTGEIVHEDSYNNMHHGGTNKYAVMLKVLLKEQWEWRQRRMLEHQRSYSEEWQCTAAPTISVPQQVGGVDCGIFTCAFATLKALEVSKMVFNQRHTTFMRRHMANCIIMHICPKLRIQGQNMVHQIDYNSIATEEPTNITEAGPEKREKEVTGRKYKRMRGRPDTRCIPSDESDAVETPSDGRKAQKVVCYRAGDNPLQWRKKAKQDETRARQQATDNMDCTTDMIIDSSSKVGCSSGRVLPIVCNATDNRAPVELSSPPSLHQVVSDESRHSDTRDVSRERHPTAALVTNELVTSRLEASINIHLRPKRARSEGMEPYSTNTKRWKAPVERDNS
jgi:hypothetical protein